MEIQGSSGRKQLLAGRVPDDEVQEPSGERNHLLPRGTARPRRIQPGRQLLVRLGEHRIAQSKLGADLAVARPGLPGDLPMPRQGSGRGLPANRMVIPRRGVSPVRRSLQCIGGPAADVPAGERVRPTDDRALAALRVMLRSCHVARADDRRKGWEDAAWALVNTKEFLLRH